MDNVDTVSQAHHSEEDQSAEAPETIKTNIIFPTPMWREVKKAAIDAHKTASQFVIEAVAEKLGIKAA